jgi:hypothetical protein
MDQPANSQSVSHINYSRLSINIQRQQPHFPLKSAHIIIILPFPLRNLHVCKVKGRTFLLKGPHTPRGT